MGEFHKHHMLSEEGRHRWLHVLRFCICKAQGKESKYLPGGPVVKNPPANAGDRGSIPSRKIPHAKGQLSLCATNTEAQAPRTCGLKQNEKPAHHS